MRRVLEWFGGSVLVYAIVAACGGVDAAGTRIPRPDSGVSSGGMMGAGGSEPVSDSGLGDALADAVDAMTDPVPDANAQTPIPAWTVVDAVCNMGAFQWSTTGFDYAEVALPGRSKADLARTVVMHHYPPEVADNQRQVTPPNTAYRDSYVGNVMVRDGAVGVVCLPDWTVTFTIPPPL